MPRRHIHWLIIVAVVSLFASGSTDRYSHSFRFLMNEVSRRALQPASQRELFDGSIHGMLSELDPNSTYSPPTQYQELKKELYQEFEGIGIKVYLDETNQRLTVGCCLPNTPVQAAGLQSGDIIQKVDGVSTENWTIAAFNKALHEHAGTSIAFEIFRPKANQTFTASIRPQRLFAESVCGDRRKPDGSWEFFLPSPANEDAKTVKKIAYVKIVAFGEKTSSEMREILKKLKAQGMSGLVIDLRGNLGGFLNSALEISDMFVKDTILVQVKGRDEEHSQTYFATPKVFCDGIPVAILIDHDTASAAEIFAACLQDYGASAGRPIVCIGSRTYGKGTIQEIITLGPLPDDRHLEHETADTPRLWERIWEKPVRGGLKITVAEYRRPNGGKINRDRNRDTDADEWGVSPNPGFESVFEDTFESFAYYQKRISGVLSPEDSCLIYDYDAPLFRAWEWFSSKK